MLKFYLLAMLLSGSFCRLPIHDPEKSRYELDLDLRLGSSHIETQEEQGSTIWAPWNDGRLESIHSSRGEPSGRDDPSNRGGSDEFLFEGSAQQAASYLRKGKARNENFETSEQPQGQGLHFINLAFQMPEFQDSSIFERQFEANRHFEPEATRHSRPITHSITHADIPSKKPPKVLSVRQLCKEHWTKENSWVEPNIVDADGTLRAISIYSSLELVGIEILDKINMIPTLQGYEHSIQTAKIRASCPSHSIRSIVAYIDLLNNISAPKLYSTPQDLIDAQKEAVSFLEGFWTKFNEQQEQRRLINENLSTDNLLFPSVVEQERFENILKHHGFYYNNSNSIAEFLFLMWMKNKFPHIHKKMHSKDFLLKWQPSVISALHAMLLTLKSNEEIQDKLKYTFFAYQKHWTYRVKAPFKINWDIK